MAPQQKMLRVFKLIRLLKQRPGKTVDQLAQFLEKDKRSVYRYLELLQEVGYEVDSLGSPPRYYLFENETRQQPPFTEEEAQVVRQALAGVSATHPLLAGIRQKLFLSSTLLPLADGLVDIHQGQIVERLAEALRDGRQVRLVGYQSPNSNTVTDRLVEPVSFTDDFSTLNAWEPAAGQEKTFKTRRIEAVAVLDTVCQYRGAGEPLDLFGWAGPQKKIVELSLTHRAYRLLIEDYPLARAYTGKRNDTGFPYFFKGEVRDFRGIGRFVLGIPGEVRIDEPEEFRGYLRGRIGEFGM
ncbi:helix-turn-helix transcriptional regulator [Larkinella punicea]|uniref:WYL domain-containing protein n=1 Tax=Larkinella punicea TaxID=2315727 RepID=A0A368JS98_9BACT|nr:WYL domain-containing protein [Larkinella punicea]RCR70540.1 WYL domain-containing protein [Larkinella punicea]